MKGIIELRAIGGLSRKVPELSIWPPIILMAFILLGRRDGKLGLAKIG